MPNVLVNGATYAFHQLGTGDPLVLLHGFGGCTQNWQPFTAELSQRHRLIAVDLRGHGHSTNPEKEFTHRKAAADVFRLLDELGYGGWIGCEYNPRAGTVKGLCWREAVKA